MNRPAPCLALSAVLALMPGVGLTTPVLYDLDPQQTFVQFEVRHFDTSTLRGRFGPLRGQVMLNAEAGRGYVGLVIDIDTLSTGLKLLDQRLRQADLLDGTGHPQAYFVAERFNFALGQPVALTGEFTLRGIGVSLTLQARRFACTPPEPATPQRCGGDFEGELLRSAFGASFGVPLVADRVRLRVQVEGVRRPLTLP